MISPKIYSPDQYEEEHEIHTYYMCAASNDKTNIPRREIVTKIFNQYHFSIETEFIAACDAGKAILYVRSFLQDLGIN